MFFLVFVLFLDCFFNMHLCAKLQPYRSKNILLCSLLLQKHRGHRGLRESLREKLCDLCLGKISVETYKLKNLKT